MLQVVNRCFQILQARQEEVWRKLSDVVLSPDVCSMQWDAFASAAQLIGAGEEAARQALPKILKWLNPEPAQHAQGFNLECGAPA